MFGPVQVVSPNGADESEYGIGSEVADTCREAGSAFECVGWYEPFSDAGRPDDIAGCLGDGLREQIDVVLGKLDANDVLSLGSVATFARDNRGLRLYKETPRSVASAMCS